MGSAVQHAEYYCALQNTTAHYRLHNRILLCTTEYYCALENITVHYRILLCIVLKKNITVHYRGLQNPRWPQDGKAHFLFTAVLRKCIFQSRKGEPLTEAFLRFINPGINKHRRREGGSTVQHTEYYCALQNCSMRMSQL